MKSLTRIEKSCASVVHKITKFYAQNRKTLNFNKYSKYRRKTQIKFSRSPGNLRKGIIIWNYDLPKKGYLFLQFYGCENSKNTRKSIFVIKIGFSDTRKANLRCKFSCIKIFIYQPYQIFQFSNMAKSHKVKRI